MNARFSELEKLGVIVEVGKKADTVSGNECTLWDVTSNLPSGKIDHNIKKKLTPRLIEKIVSLGKKVPSEWKPHLREIYQIAKQI